MLDRLRKLFGSKPAPSQAGAEWAESYVRPAETADRWTVAGRADLLVARIMGSVGVAIDQNTAACMTTTLRLYRKAGTKKGKRFGTGKRVASKKRLAWLRGELADKPDRKTIAFAESSDDIEEVTDGPVVDFVRQPNPWMTGDEWAYLRFKGKEATGNAYAWGVAEGAVVEAYWLAPQCVRIVATPENPVALYRFSRNMTDWLEMDPADVAHFKHRPSLQDFRIGDTWTLGLLKQLDIYEAAIDSELARQRNMSRPDYVVEATGQMTPDSKNEIRQKLQNDHRGPSQAGKVLVLTNAKINPVGWAPKDLENQKLLEYIDRLIDRAADRPESVSRNNDASRANGNTGLIQLMRYMALPRQSKDAHDLTQFVMPLFGLDPNVYSFAYDNCVPEDEDAQRDMHIALANAGLKTWNETRAEIGEEPYPPDIGDVPRVNGVPAQTVADLQEAKQAQADALAERSDPQKAKRLMRSLLQLPCPAHAHEN